MKEPSVLKLEDALEAAKAQIEKTSRENAILFKLSSSIATTRNKADLFDVIDQQLKQLFLFEDFVICLINDDQTTHSAFLYNEKESFQKNEGIAPVSTAKYSLEDGLCHAMIGATDPIVFYLDEVVKWPDAPVWIGFWHNMGIKEMIGLPIVDQGKCVGFFYLYCKVENSIANSYFELLKTISMQISVAVANIRANEKIEQQLAEINIYKQQLEEERSYLKEQIAITYNYDEIVGNSPLVQMVYRSIEQVAPSDSTVLILGETGTGKELIARAIHNASSRKDKLMIKLNCAALPPSLAESELFGHEKGSFTGAIARRIGKFELANNGTLFLDEIGELPLELQAKLLRAIQEKEIERVGGSQVIKINIRIIAATNRNLYQDVQAGTFRSDLFYRLNVFPIQLPALRDRREDIEQLACHFLLREAKKTAKKPKRLSKAAVKTLQAYDWPGNIRELEHVIERTILLTKGEVIKEIELPVAGKRMTYGEASTIIKTIAENERDHILAVLKQCDGKISGPMGAAKVLGVPATTLNSKLKKLKISRKHVQED
ncbi:sigma 54-interacting transcriptional regulator [Pedobacter sp. MC2016-14]|uniref:sigma-54-dependent Fis family transcriptional regulator n=1 Tax=Pedobacter sp. MC2016-14 TaxID=2897327 RepID=UPI001E4AC9EF|nr:sigma 54-interacting transcriptional regulator [Pedobacter sp. MC2016-14]MCD0487866.1 sigma 54-interacting transcriptional regulator [Pedobacter sp. MC2016-14]